MNDIIRDRGNRLLEMKHMRGKNYEYRLQLTTTGQFWSGVMGWHKDKRLADVYGSHESANKVREWLATQGIKDVGFMVNRVTEAKGQACMGCGSTNTFVDGPDTIGCHRCGNLSDRRR